MQARWRGVFVLFLGARLAWPQAGAVEDAVADLQRGDFALAEQLLRAELQAHPSNIEALAVMGVVLDNEKKFDDAGEMYRRSLRLAPRNPSLLNNYGNHLVASGKLDEAGAIFRKVLTINPAQTNALIQLAHLALRGKKPTEANALLKRLPADAQENPDASILRMQVLYALKQDREAARLLDRLRTTAAPFALGTALAAAGQYGAAEDAFSRAEEASPDNFEILYALGLAASRAGHNDRALTALESALRLQPENAGVIYDLAAVQIAMNQEEAALKTLANGIKVAPDRVDLQRLFAHTAADLGYFGDAVEAWDRYLKLAPDDDSARRERAFARTMVPGNPAIPLSELQSFVRKHPDDALGYFEYGTALAGSDPTLARSEMDRALQLRPDLASAHLARGLLNYRQGKFSQALNDFDFDAKRDPSNPAVLDRLGQTLMALDRSAEAVTVLKKASELAPNDSRVLLHFGRALAAAGEMNQSSAVMARVREIGPDRSADPHPPGLADFLNLSPQEQFARYRAGIERTLEKDPSNTEARVRHLEVLLREEKTSEAAADVQTLRQSHLSPALSEEAGRILVEARRYELAKQLLLTGDTPGLDLAIAIFHADGKNAGLAQLGRISPAARTGDWELASIAMLGGDASEVLVAKATSKGGTRPDLYRDAALALLHSRQKRRAAELLDSAARKLPDNPEILLLRDVAGGTAAQWKEIEDRWPDWFAVWTTHAAVLSSQGEIAKARKMLDAANALAPESAPVRDLTALIDAGRTVDPVRIAEECLR